MKVRTESLSGAALDWVVAQVDNRNVFATLIEPVLHAQGIEEQPAFTPSKDWGFVGMLIEREEIALIPTYLGWYVFMDSIDANGSTRRASTTAADPAVAVLRCYVLAKLGEEVDVPTMPHAAPRYNTKACAANGS